MIVSVLKLEIPLADSLCKCLTTELLMQEHCFLILLLFKFIKSNLH